MVSMMQQDALDILESGANVFLTGEPGAGKSYTVRQYVAFLASRGVQFSLTASTGIAATHIGGMTIHSWSGLGIRKALTKYDIDEMRQNAKLVNRVKKTSVLIIDEISMLDAAMLDCVDLVCRRLRESDAPFGGIQIVFVGDFFQLPPVSRQHEPIPTFAFFAESWRRANPTICYLSEQHRQDDAGFLDILAALRRGAIDEDHVAVLHARRIPPDRKDVTKLYSHNMDVDRMNMERLRLLGGKEKTFAMSSYGAPNLVAQMKRGCLSPEKLVLKIGARVMFTRNNPAQGYVNGSTGDIVDFDGETKFPVVQMSTGRMVCVEPESWSIDVNSRPLATITQIPLRLAWAMTVHKSQGMSLDAAFIDLAGAFAYGQGYVALSRVRSLSGLFLGGLNARSLEVDPTVLEVDGTFRERSLAAEEMIGGMSQEEKEAAKDAFVERCGGKSESEVVASPDDALAEYFAVAEGESAIPRKQRRVRESRAPKAKKEPKWTETLKMILEGDSVEEVARKRARTVGTIIGHLVEVQELDKLPVNVFENLKKNAKELVDDIRPVMEELEPKGRFLRPVFDRFQGKYSYDELKLVQWLMGEK